MVEKTKKEKKPRKPYVITKPRENWTPEEHQTFLDCLKIYERDWKMINTIIKTKTVIQIRSHAQKHFLKLAKAGKKDEIPPPRPKKRIPSAADLPRPNTVHAVASLSQDFAQAAPMGAWIPGNLMGMHQSCRAPGPVATPSASFGINAHAPYSIANSLTGLEEIDSHSTHHLPENTNLGFGADLGVGEVPMPPPPQPEATFATFGSSPQSHFEQMVPFQQPQQESQMTAANMANPQNNTYGESTFASKAAASKQLPSEWLEEAAPLRFPEEPVQPVLQAQQHAEPHQDAPDFQKVYNFISNVVDPLYDSIDMGDDDEPSLTSCQSFSSSHTISTTASMQSDMDMDCNTNEVSFNGKYESMSQEQDEIFGELQNMGSMNRGMVNHMMENLANNLESHIQQHSRQLFV